MGPTPTPQRPSVAFGPEAPGWGSWDWTGADILRALEPHFATRSFRAWEVPDADVVVLVKHGPPPGWADVVARRAALIYGPVDRYGSPAEIDADAPWLRRCARILVHCERLRRYVAPYAPVEFMDHHVKFAAPLRAAFHTDGDLLWVGVRTNLPPLVAWVNAHPPPAPLDILTNPEDPACVPTPAELGFRPGRAVRVHAWSPEAQVELTTRARGILDVKGDDFRSRHKPPAKGLDAIASGVPLAMNPDSSTAEHLARLGFDLCTPLEAERWFSRAYWEETRRFGAALRELLAPERIARRYGRIIDEVLAARAAGGSSPRGPRGTPEPPVTDP